MIVFNLEITIALCRNYPTNRYKKSAYLIISYADSTPPPKKGDSFVFFQYKTNKRALAIALLLRRLSLSVSVIVSLL